MALVLTVCVGQAEGGGVEAAWLPGAGGETDGPVPAGLGQALGLGQRHVGVRLLVEHLGGREEPPADWEERV